MKTSEKIKIFFAIFVSLLSLISLGLAIYFFYSGDNTKGNYCLFLVALNLFTLSIPDKNT